MSGNLIIVLGATATGKTDLAIKIAQALNGEIIGADSRQIYRYMPIGTAQPTPEQQALVPHHLVGFVEPTSHLSLADYQSLALASIADILSRGKQPLLVGGTGQYITAIEEGWSIPQVSPNNALRDELEAFANEHGADALHQRLFALDPEYAQKIHPNNVRRVVRALEVCLETGDTVTNQQQKRPLPYRICRIGLTLSREPLYQRADARVDAMMRSGFLGEVKNLLNMGFDRRLPSLSGVGYSELCAHLLDNEPPEASIARTKFNTHDFIRRQEIWFKGHDNGILWHNSLSLDENVLIQSLQGWLKE